MSWAFAESQESVDEPLRITDGLEGIEPQADRILREMSDYLKAHQEYNFYAEITYDSMLSNGQEIQYGGATDVSVRRHGGLNPLPKECEQILITKIIKSKLSGLSGSGVALNVIAGLLT